ncbi:hypothetical protein [Ktedonospora formicarum]|uniref:Uncharacterized protein n=1 Tax=Ktedonospora formicarum TaxID=2778364 RepID=A0A8J3HZL8_9CHLR|nr:hypothetical protein [Ktedonospora formicarum]GHO42189.1 hypothetical protein KSX_03520 [Ktedonospora formicarum]
MIFQDPMQLFCNKTFFGTIDQYFYETPWASGRLIVQDEDQHDFYMRVTSFRDWAESSHESHTNLSREESDKQYYQEMARRGLSEEDLDRCDEMDWTIVTSDGQEHETRSLSFYVYGYIQWRW